MLLSGFSVLIDLCILNIFNTRPIPQQNQLLTNDIHSDMYWLSPPFVKRKTPFFLYLSPLFIPKSTCLRIGVLYIHSCKSSNSLMSNPKNNLGFISRVNSISFANTFGIWTRDKLVYFSPCQYWYGKYKCIV